MPNKTGSGLSVFLSSPAGWLPSGTLSHNLVLCLLPHKSAFFDLLFFIFMTFTNIMESL